MSKETKKEMPVWRQLLFAFILVVLIGFSFDLGRWFAAHTLPDVQAAVYEVKYIVEVDE